MAYHYDTTVKLHQTDSAGLLFFAAQLEMAHDAYETFLATSGESFAKIFAEKKFLLPIVHAESDYLAALKVGDTLAIGLSAEKISTHSFVLKYEFTRNDQAVGSVKTVHVCVDPASGTKMELPVELRNVIASIA